MKKFENMANLTLLLNTYLINRGLSAYQQKENIMAKKATNPTVTLSVFATGERFIDGTIVRQDEQSVTVRYKKPRSSKFLVETFPREKVVSVWEGEEAAQVVVAGARYELDTFTGELAINEQGDFVVTGEDFTVTISSKADVEIFEEDEEEKPAKKASKKAEAKPAKKTAKKVEEDEDEEDEDEEDEDEEEKPTKKASKKAAKKVEVEEEDEEDEDDEWE